MKKLLLFILLCAMLLTGCGTEHSSTEPTTVPATAAEVPTTTAAAPVHSALYIPEADVKDVIGWFNEVCLAAEFVNGGDPSFLQNWDRAISYMVHGDPTEEDRAVLGSFTQWLNTLEGFPGISETTDPSEANLNIYFCTQAEMRARMGDWADNLDGAVTFWYENDRIYNRSTANTETARCKMP